MLTEMMFALFNTSKIRNTDLQKYIASFSCETYDTPGKIT